MADPGSSTSTLLETLRLEHVPETHSVHVAVFRDVENVAFLHQQLLARNAEFEYAFIDAGVVCTSSSLFKFNIPLSCPSCWTKGVI
jgi:hypothetical protein